jgi:hypothetical protein
MSYSWPADRPLRPESPAAGVRFPAAAAATAIGGGGGGGGRRRPGRVHLKSRLLGRAAPGPRLGVSCMRPPPPPAPCRVPSTPPYPLPPLFNFSPLVVLVVVVVGAAAAAVGRGQAARGATAISQLTIDVDGGWGRRLAIVGR